MLDAELNNSERNMVLSTSFEDFPKTRRTEIYLVNCKIGPLLTVLTGKSLVTRGRKGNKYFDSGNEIYIFMIQLFESFNKIPGFSSCKHRNLGYAKSGKIGNIWFLEKVIRRVKSQCLENLFGMFHKKIETFSADVIRTLLQN